MNPARLSDLETFAAVARHRSFRRAAEQRKLSTSMVSRIVRNLEDHLGVELLKRTTRSVSPTSAGAALLAELQPALGQIHAAVERINLHRGKPAGSLRLNAPAPVAQFLLSCLVARFVREYADISVEIFADAAKADIVRDGFDAGVRIDKDLPQDMVAVRIGKPQRYAVVAAPSYLADRPAIRVPRDLAGHECIRRRFPGGALQPWDFQRRGGKVDVPVGRVVVNDALIAVNVAAEGGGIAYVHENYARHEIAAGTLVRLLEPWAPGITAPQLYYPRQRYVPAALRAFIDFARAIGPEVP